MILLMVVEIQESLSRIENQMQSQLLLMVITKMMTLLKMLIHFDSLIMLYQTE